LALKPEEAEIPKIKEKIANGLPPIEAKVPAAARSRPDPKKVSIRTLLRQEILILPFNGNEDGIFGFSLTRIAPAKINLALHVVGQRSRRLSSA
jgi:hypothetical protein